MRKLAVFCAAFSAGIFAAHYIIPQNILIFVILFSSVCVLLSFFLKKKKLALIALAAVLGLTFYGAAYKLVKEKAARNAGSTQNVQVLVISELKDYGTYSSVNVRLLDKQFHSGKAVLYDYDSVLHGICPGDVLELECSVKTADTRYGEQVDYNNAKGIFYKLYVKGDSYTYVGTRFTADVLGTEINSFFSRKVHELFSDDVSGFLTALMLGDKQGIYDDTENYLALSRAGFMHVAAVSGMHIAFVVGVIQILFGTGALSSGICLALMWLFVLFTGGSASAVRAAIMQSVLLAAPLFRRENDSLTSLSFALMCILLFNPFAIASVSLQFSFAAVLGICLFAQKLTDALTIRFKVRSVPGKLLRKLYGYIMGVIAVSLSVTVFTLPLSVIYYGYFSVVSVLMNAAALWAVPICFAGGYLSVLISIVSPVIGHFISLPVAGLARYILNAASFFASFDGAVIYFADNTLYYWLIFTAVVLTLCIFGLKNTDIRLKAAAVATLSAGMLFFITQYSDNYYRNKTDSLTVLDVGQGQCISAFSGDSTILVDCGNLDRYFSNAGDTAAAYLSSCGRKGIDAVIFTHLHSDHTSGFEHLACLMDVERVYVPYGCEQDEFYSQLLEICEKYSIEMIVIDTLTSLSFDDLDLYLIPPDENDDTNERCIKIVLKENDFSMLVTGDSGAAEEKSLISSYRLPDINVLVAGHHGSRYSSCGEFLESIGADTAVISCGQNSYGLPTFETLERLKAYGYNIYRTDLNGNISFSFVK